MRFEEFFRFSFPFLNAFLWMLMKHRRFHEKFRKEKHTKLFFRGLNKLSWIPVRHLIIQTCCLGVMLTKMWWILSRLRIWYHNLQLSLVNVTVCRVELALKTWWEPVPMSLGPKARLIQRLIKFFWLVYAVSNVFPVANYDIFVGLILIDFAWNNTTY